MNVKGKSARQGELSGFVPFLQISVNEQCREICSSPSDARVRVFYKNENACKVAFLKLNSLLDEMLLSRTLAISELQTLDASISDSVLSGLQFEMCDPSIVKIDTFAPRVYGLELPEKVLREAYIIRPDISPRKGWETGRESAPAFMDMNLKSLRCVDTTPRIVLFQYDAVDAMNPHGLLLAYEEEQVEPVVSDFDPFTFGSRGMSFERLPHDQIKVVKQCLYNIRKLLDEGIGRSWTSSWVDILKQAEFHPKCPDYGFGDPTSTRIVAQVVDATASCGAVRHGPECFNFFFPQELDAQHLVIWDGFAGPGWQYLEENALQKFLLDRVGEGYCFPLNPAWVLRDPSWLKIWHALQASSDAQGPLASWYPSGILEEINDIARKFPDGFCETHVGRKSVLRRRELSVEEMANQGLLEVSRFKVLQRAKRKLGAALAIRDLAGDRKLPNKSSDVKNLKFAQSRFERDSTLLSNGSKAMLTSKSFLSLKTEV